MESCRLRAKKHRFYSLATDRPPSHLFDPLFSPYWHSFTSACTLSTSSARMHLSAHPRLLGYPPNTSNLTHLSTYTCQPNHLVLFELPEKYGMYVLTRPATRCLCQTI